ncbi:MAG: polyprenol monophosphomannose synthase [Armatimonadetes bacterium]|nr:polyprenol monophosphomannose synthase [Armatimonadota bacterium]
MPDLSVVVPTYNEREMLPLFLARIADVARGLPLEVVVVDDNSPDGTADAAGALGRQYAGRFALQVVRRPGKVGLATAVLDGAKAARAPVVAVMDCDLSHPPELLPRLLEAVRGGAGIAVASRYVPGGGIRDWPLWRRGVSRVATLMARLVLGGRVRDPVSGFFAARREILTGPTYWGMGFKILLEVLARAPRARVVEIPYVFVDRAVGRSKLSKGEMSTFLRLLWRLRALRARGERGGSPNTPFG